MARAYEDFSVGEVVEAGPHLITAEDIKSFAARFDPQPMHLDGSEAQNTLVDGLYASGMHTVCIHMRLLVDGFLRDTRSMGSPGVEEVRYLAPVRAGDSLSLRLEVTNLGVHMLHAPQAGMSQAHLVRVLSGVVAADVLVGAGHAARLEPASGQ